MRTTEKARLRSYFEERIRLAEEMWTSTDLPVTYGDVALILCTVISACAAHRWPGRGIDKCRFVELLVRLSPTEFHTSWVSVPALLNDQHVEYAHTPYGHRSSDRIYTGKEVDLSHDDARQRFSGLTDSLLRHYSYASLIYDRLRCAYVHEYKGGRGTSPVPASHRSAHVSYIGRGEPVRRMICFHPEYLESLARHHAALVCAEPEKPPAQWWLDST